MRARTKIYYLLILSLLLGCDKDFLDAKPNTNIIIPEKLEDFKSLLDNTTNLNLTSSLGQMAADEYIYIDYPSWQGAFSAVERNSYIWKKDIYEGELQILDWNYPYRSVFYANNVIEGLEQLKLNPSGEYNQIMGWALFIRAYAFYDLVRTFSNAYDPASANSDLGIPLRTNANIDVLLPRSSVQESYNLIISDLKKSCRLLIIQFQQTNRNRPSKGTAYALLSRIYLSMNKYEDAELYADSSLALYSKLIDYNTISLTSATPFNNSNDETLISTSQVPSYTITGNTFVNTAVTVHPDLINSYSVNDLRLNIYFGRNALGNYYVKRGYFGSGSYPFSGLATDELYLIKSECLARRGEITQAMELLNTLLRKRFKQTVPYIPISANTKEEAIEIILLERKKELVWRGLRWSDIKRLNKINAGITLKRLLNGIEYTLLPNDPKYALPIPEDEISRSGIIQNPR